MDLGRPHGGQATPWPSLAAKAGVSPYPGHRHRLAVGRLQAGLRDGNSPYIAPIDCENARAGGQVFFMIMPKLVAGI
jgi:hypothetical protein